MSQLLLGQEFREHVFDAVTQAYLDKGVVPESFDEPIGILATKTILLLVADSKSKEFELLLDAYESMFGDGAKMVRLWCTVLATDRAYIFKDLEDFEGLTPELLEGRGDVLFDILKMVVAKNILHSLALHHSDGDLMWRSGSFDGFFPCSHSELRSEIYKHLT